MRHVFDLVVGLSWLFSVFIVGIAWRSERGRKRAPEVPPDPDMFDRLLEVDEQLTEAGYPEVTPFWRETFERFLRSGKRWLVGRVGRRGGKGITSCKIGVVFGLYCPVTLPPGERAFVQFLSVDRDEAANRLRMIEAMLTALGKKYTRRGDEIDLVERPVTFRITTASIRGTVGRTTILAICDEGARWRDAETGANPAREILASLAPSMATQPDARGCFLSAPWSENDAHAQRFEEGDTDRQMTCYAPSWVANTTLSKENTQRDEPDPRTWSREYLAMPVAGITSICDAAHLASRTSKATRRTCVGPGCHAVTLDAGFAHDAFAATAWHRELREGPDGSVRDVLVQDAVLHIKPTFFAKVKIEDAVDALARFAKDFGVREVFGDSFYCEALGPMMSERGIILRVLGMSPAQITQRVQSFQARLAADEAIELLAHEAQRKEILEAHLIHHSGGRVTLRAPENARNKHDDILATILLAHDAEVIGKLPPSEGDLVMTSDDVRFDRETHTVSGGRLRYWRKGPGGRLIEREPPMHSLEFELHAEEMLARGETTPAIERWMAERAKRTHENESDGISIPIVSND